MSDTIVSYIRTYVPILVGTVLAWIGKELGIELDSPELKTGFTVLVIAIYYAVARTLEKRWAFMGYLLGVPKQPSYEPHL